MLEYDSPKVQRAVTPSPLRATPTRSKRELCDMYSTTPPRFVLDALEGASDTTLPSELPKHFLRDFQFRVVGGHFDPTSAEMSRIASFFPGCKGVAYVPPYLVVSWSKEQVKPWPLTVGGMPLYYATPEHPYPPTVAKGGRSAPIMRSIGEKLQPWDAPSNEIIREIARTLVTNGIGVKLFGWCGVRWYAEVLTTSDGMKMPSTICGLVVMWKVFSSYGESARRSIIPSEHIIDSTSYKPTLRPGVLLESMGGAGTTSGVPLRGRNGEQFFTVALHGFQFGENREVHHPFCENENSLIGHVQVGNPFPGSDIGLVLLEDGMTYSTVSFDGEEVDGIDLKGFVHSNDLQIGEIVCMDSPYNGRCEGVLGWKGVDVIDPIDAEHPELTYVSIHMIYFGNGASDVKPGSCGSALWNNENEIAAFFRWYDPEAAVAYAPSVNVLIEAGYAVEAIP